MNTKTPDLDPDAIILTLAVKVGVSLKQRGLLLVSAESCTGGWLGQAVTAVAGSSAWYERGFITYSNAAKHEELDVSMATIEKHGAVSEMTAREMVLGALKRSHAQVGVAVTGIAGPTGGSQIKPVGTVCFAWAVTNGDLKSETCFFDGDRETVRRQSVIRILEGILYLLND